MLWHTEILLLHSRILNKFTFETQKAAAEVTFGTRYRSPKPVPQWRRSSLLRKHLPLLSGGKTQGRNQKVRGCALMATTHLRWPSRPPTETFLPQLAHITKGSLGAGIVKHTLCCPKQFAIQTWFRMAGFRWLYVWIVDCYGFWEGTVLSRLV